MSQIIPNLVRRVCPNGGRMSIARVVMLAVDSYKQTSRVFPGIPVQSGRDIMERESDMFAESLIDSLAHEGYESHALEVFTKDGRSFMVVKVGRKHYDAETLNGVLDPNRLPVVKRHWPPVGWKSWRGV